MKRVTRVIGASLALTALIGSLAACSSEKAATTADEGDITLNLTVFTDFGYEPLLAEYKTQHPNVTVNLNQVGQADLATQLTTQLAAGKGAPDVVGLGASAINTFSKYKTKFLNLADYGANDIKDNWVPWAFEAGTVDEGKTVLGYRTDTGGLAMCYNKDLFAAAGLPTDRDEVSKLWASWDDYSAAGEKFKAANTGAFWTDNVQDIYQTRLYQLVNPILTADNKVNTDSDNKTAFYDSTALSNDGLTAKVAPFSQDLQTALAQGKIATSFCPPWYSGLLQSWAGEQNSGKWDIASIPGGSGNWGGSYLLVPAQTEHPQAAADLAAWLTDAAQQEKTFTAGNFYPSAVKALDSSAVQDATSSYFSDAPIGKIYGDAVKKITGQDFGYDFETVQGSFLSAASRVEQGLQSQDDAWAQAVSEAEAHVASE